MALNFDDLDNEPVREYFIENVLMWYRDFHIDALRLNACVQDGVYSPGRGGIVGKPTAELSGRQFIDSDLHECISLNMNW